jgi:toxin ParE1/3/4
MKRKAYKISNQALIDLEQIWLYTFRNWSIEQSDRYYNLLINEMDYVSQNQESGKSMNHIKNGYRASKVKSHLIFYKTSSESEIEIIRILHERMDIENRLKE